MSEEPLRVRLIVPAPHPEQVGIALEAAGVVEDPAAAVGVAVQPGRAVDRCVDRWIVDSRPHVLVAAHPHGIDVGPWVLPGVSPCAHCVAAATLGSLDERLPPLSAALWSLAAGWVARDIRAWLRGEAPSTWATSWLMGSDPIPAARRWERHPYCGCAWFDL